MFKKHILLITVCFGSICFGFENINCFNKINVKSKNKIDNISSDFIDDDIYMIKDISFENGKKGKMFFIKNENIVGETYEKNNLLILKITSLILCFLMIVSCFIPFKVNISVNPNYDEYAYRSLFLYLFYPGSNMSILNLELYVFFGSLTIGSLLLTPILFMFSNIKEALISAIVGLAFGLSTMILCLVIFGYGFVYFMYSLIIFIYILVIYLIQKRKNKANNLSSK